GNSERISMLFKFYRTAIIEKQQLQIGWAITKILPLRGNKITSRVVTTLPLCGNTITTQR
ncbi:hypothetical protein, partial [Prevotella illustrans]|uniref:hypothetical protein n=1 Tax=Prevotella illustrans TaxID=2800387 RepID=UPI001A9F1C71